MLVKLLKMHMETILKNNKNRIINIVILLIITILFIVLFVLRTEVPCMFKSILGISCPGCGMTRAIGEIFKLNLLEAIKYNIFSVFMFVFILLSCVFILIDIFKNSNKYLTFINKTLNKYWYIFILILVVMFIINNIIY